ncbi:MAG: hypothetical protein HQ509_10255 [Candidatus Marinimicrobia bacterium]|nr:hypothetical protein [Candidatus Neomarinimicrobiota bacterium]
MQDAAPNWLKNLEKYMPGPNSKYGDKVAGFWVGFLHGIILPLTFIYSQFNTNVKLYETNNVDRWYNVAFVIGLIMLARILVGNR